MQEAEAILKKHNLSITQARKSILEVLATSKRPLNVKQIKRQKKIESINESSIYRNLNKLEEMGIIQSISGVDDSHYFELKANDDDHHHITCSNCLIIQCLDTLELDQKMKEVAIQAGFSLQDYSIALKGLCLKCQ